MQIDMISPSGEKAGTAELNEKIFNQEINKDLIHQAIVQEQGNLRRSFAFKKNRALIKATSSKMYKQKGTGNARHGARSANIFRGGGLAFGGQMRNFKRYMPVKMKRAALYSMLSLKVRNGSLTVVTEIPVKDGKTKEIFSVFQKIADPGRKTLLIHSGVNPLLPRAAKNISKLNPIHFSTLNVLSLYKTTNVLLDQDALSKINELEK